MGQLNLQPLLKSPELRQLDQRISIRYELKPLSREEVGAYVSHRLAVAGGSATVAFTPRSIDRIHRISSGIPRLVNLICDRALLCAYTDRSTRVVPTMIAKAAESLDLVPPRAGLFGWVRRRAAVAVATLGIAAMIGVAAGGWALRGSGWPFGALDTPPVPKPVHLLLPAGPMPGTLVMAVTRGAAPPEARPAGVDAPAGGLD